MSGTEAGTPDADEGRREPFRSGFITFVGRPNAGKSTLTNALVGEKIAITSDKPQTTRRAVRGIVHAPEGQLVIVDTPGLHRPRTLLGERLNDVVAATLSEVDAIAFCLPADERIGPGDRYIVEQLAAHPGPAKIGLVTKVEKASPEAVAAQLLQLDAMAPWEFLMPVSALERIRLDEFVREALRLMPPGPPLYPAQMRTEESFEQRAAELVREAALQDARQELPHSIAVTIEEVVLREDGSAREVYANLIVERDSQKGIVIGRGGGRLRRIREAAQAEIQAISEDRIVLSLHVKVAKEWQRDPKQLGRLGF
ncbi:MAG: GTPase Era [Pseudoclavibacter sp.]|nr:GTPase Era [Pseudoclavibacter sp.]